MSVCLCLYSTLPMIDTRACMHKQHTAKENDTLVLTVKYLKGGTEGALLEEEEEEYICINSLGVL